MGQRKTKMPTTFQAMEFEIMICLLIASVMELVFLVYFIVVEETWKRGHFLTISEIGTPFNIALLIIGGSLSTLLSLELCIIRFEGAFNAIVVAQDVLDATIQIGYIFYSYERAKGILEHIFPFATTWLHRFLSVAPFLLYLEAIPDIIILASGESSRLDDIGQILTIIGGTIGITLDILFLYSFMRFLWLTRQVKTPDNRFQIISRYGISSSVFMVLALAMFAVFSSDHSHWFLGVTICFNFAFLVLILMKVSLHYDKMRRMKNTTISALQHQGTKRSTHSTEIYRPTIVK
ncbi:hypothetical protein BCR33DRAFT_418302 [Rhizoclosmatium globosum]|uniref:Uncharacterized protein n=1 Tax=Rhizoclosmatium globosum TaxID=329046 RepID=A0A1Y2BWH6_9FUNG|nr:hypothetical protein BCR33DRAFT_418302 [Rhizoclosmatium globosum]|eukprot:ORY39120.1 hypothetical protein BCR33DRAFT_418302 [Rhizoclosmatium globosum]